MKKYLLILFTLLVVFQDSNGQDTEKLVQLSGVVRTEYLQPLQFVHILILNKHQGTISDTKGMFSFVVQPHDTIMFSAVGYKRTGLIIPDTLETFNYPVDVIMETDTIEIREVIILPWKTYQEFKQAFLALELPDDDLQRAFHNLAMIHRQIHNPDAAPDPDLNYQYHLREQYNATYSKGQTPYYSIFNPLKWAEFFKYLEEGKFKDPNKDR
ncbi:carboxypeptidase-like regulatory domain-containing protein [Bacteroidota bacterium]